MNDRVSLQPAYVLHRRGFRDTSLIVEAWTQEHGRVALVARGARRPRSPWHGMLEPFRPLLMSWTGRNELRTLTGAEVAGAVSRLMGSVLISGLYLNELLVRLCHRDDPHPALFRYYGESIVKLAQLCDAARSAAAARERLLREEQRVLRIFEKHLLGEIGYGLLLDRDGESGVPVSEHHSYHYVAERGPVDARLPLPGSSALVISGRSLLSFQRDELVDDNSLRDAKRLVRVALAKHLGDKPLESRYLRQFLEKNTLASVQTGKGQ